MQVEVTSSLGNLSQRWDELVASRPCASPYLRSWWLQVAAGPRPRFLLVFDDGLLVGGIALEEDRPLGVARLRPMGFALSPDHVGAVAAPGREQEVTAALARWLRRPGHRLLDLHSVDDHGGLLPKLGVPVTRETLDVVPWVRLEGTFESYLEQRVSSSLRQKFRRFRRRFERAGVRLRTAAPADVERAMRDFTRLHLARWGGDSLVQPHLHRLHEVARVGTRLGEMSFNELVVGDEVIATYLLFEAAGRTSYYQAGVTRDPTWANAGQVLLGCLIERAFARGHHTFDLLRGGADYKLRWATDSWDLVRAQAAVGAGGRATQHLVPVLFRTRGLLQDRLARRPRRRRGVQRHQMASPSER